VSEEEEENSQVPLVLPGLP